MTHPEDFALMFQKSFCYVTMIITYYYYYYYYFCICFQKFAKLIFLQVYVKHKGGKQYGVSYRLKEPGQYVLYVKWGDEHVPGSPYQINV